MLRVIYALLLALVNWRLRMKTQEQLSKMTEQDLTFELACLVFNDCHVYTSKRGKVGVSTDTYTGYVSINDWSWLMPLFVKHGNNLRFMNNGKWSAICELEDDSFHATAEEELQRAIAICLILKLQEIQE